MSHPPEDWSKFLEDPWTFNPYPVDSRVHEGWKDVMLWAKEHVVLFSSEMLEKMPQEGAPNQAFLNHRLEGVAGLFDIWAQALSRSCVLTDDAAQGYERLLNELERAVLEDSNKHIFAFSPKQLQVAETKNRLNQRRNYWAGQMLRKVREHKEATRTRALANSVSISKETPLGMDTLPVLPTLFQNAFELAKATAELHYVTRGERFLNNPRIAEIPIHQCKMIQDVFFAFCCQARGACREEGLTVAQLRQAVENAWPVICDTYFIRLHGDASEEARSTFRVAMWKTIENDQQWKQHLSEFIELAELDRKQPSGPNTPNPILPTSNGSAGLTQKESKYPNRASWLSQRLIERSWNKHDLSRQGGPDHKTTQKALAGLEIREDALAKIAQALSKKTAKVSVTEIPRD